MSHASATTPFVSILPTRRRVNPSTYEGAETLYVTQNEKGATRAFTGFVLDLAVGDSIEARHTTRNSSYGVLTVVGMVQAGAKVGDLPEANVPLRIAG